jgi:hypothetical protein
MTTGFSQVRVNLPVKRLQEPMEDLWQVRQVIWKRTLASQPEGIDMPQFAMHGLEQRGVDIQQIEGGKFTADLLDGKFRGKPYGSNDTADPIKQRNDFTGFMTTLPPLMQTNPFIAQMLMTPDAAKALLEKALDVFGIKDKQPFLGMAGQSATGTQQLIADPMIQQALMPQMGMGGAPMGAPPVPPVAGGGAPPPMPEPMGAM